MTMYACFEENGKFYAAVHEHHLEDPNGGMIPFNKNGILIIEDLFGDDKLADQECESNLLRLVTPEEQLKIDEQCRQVQ